MKGTAKAIALAALVLGGAAAPASAHPRDLMTPERAGPIRQHETTLAELRSWFGPPNHRETIRVGCVRVIKARWQGLKVYAYRDGQRRVAAAFVHDRRLESDEHGTLRIHTKRGLRVGDTRGDLRELYPNAEPMQHGNHTHFRLRRAGLDGSSLLAKVIDGEVVQLEFWPFEFC